MPLNYPPLGYTGEVQTGSNTASVKEGIVRAATATEAAAATLNTVYLSPATAGSFATLPLTVANGGTGDTTLLNHGVLLGQGTSAVAAVAVGATGTLLAGATGANPAWTASPSVTGSFTAGTSITATLGNITATNGNLVLSAAGNKLQVHATTAASDSVGVSGVMAGTPGAVTVTTSACTASSVILFSRATTSGTPGQVSITAQAGGSFTLTSTGNETSTFNYLIIN